MEHFINYYNFCNTCNNNNNNNNNNNYYYYLALLNVTIINLYSDMTGLQEFQKAVSTIQRDAVWWLHVVVPKMFSPSGKDFLSW